MGQFSLEFPSAMKAFYKVSSVFLLCHVAKETQGETAGAAAAGGAVAEEGGSAAGGRPNTRLWTGNAAIDGGIVGLGAGLLGGAVLGGLLTSLVQCQCDYSLTWHDNSGAIVLDRAVQMQGTQSGSLTTLGHTRLARYLARNNNKKSIRGTNPPPPLP